jgi:hypothetical protein
MFEFQWNALRVGDRVTVHDDLADGFELREGVVHIVESRAHAVNDVAIRLDNGDIAIQHPRRHAVHLLPLDGRPPCWRCEAIAALPESGGQAGWMVAA